MRDGVTHDRKPTIPVAGVVVVTAIVLVMYDTVRALETLAVAGAVPPSRRHGSSWRRW